MKTLLHPKVEACLLHATTQIDLEKRLQNLLIQGVDRNHLKEGWRAWGKTQYNQRLLNIACLIITNANYGRFTTFSELNKINLGAGYLNTLRLLETFALICKEANWPMYSSLVVKKYKANPTDKINENLFSEEEYEDSTLCLKLTKYVPEGYTVPSGFISWYRQNHSVPNEITDQNILETLHHNCFHSKVPDTFALIKAVTPHLKEIEPCAS